MKDAGLRDTSGRDGTTLSPLHCGQIAGIHGVSGGIRKRRGWCPSGVLTVRVQGGRQADLSHGTG